MPVHNEDIARIFDEIADLLEIEEANPFRVRAYRNAARTVRALGRSLAEMVEQGEDLTRLPGIGKDLAAKIEEIVTTGHAGFLDRLHKELPASLEDLLHIRGLGPKRVKVLYKELGVTSLEELERAVRDGRVRSLPGFGARTEQQILETLASRHVEKKQRFLYSVARDYAEPLVAWIRKARGVDQVVVAGSYRRGRETVGDLDILATAAEGSRVIDHFVGYEEVGQVVSQGHTRASVILRCGLQVDLRVVASESFGAALHYFTGSKAHNIAVRRLGQKRGLKINEYGVFRGDRRIAGRTEAEVYATVDLPEIPPPLRENRGEIEAAREGRLPRLIRLQDLRGDLHVHTRATDGRQDLEAMARAAQAAGLEYIAITDHSRHLTVARGLDEKRLRAQLEEIDRLNDRLHGITVLKGIEVDILEDGRLDLPDHVLAELDVVVAAVHDHFGLSREKQTRRIQRAMDHKYFSILAHPTGRLLQERPAYEVDMERIIEQARSRPCFLEINAQPTRLDLNDIHCRMARDAGVLMAINSDGHHGDDFGNLVYGIHQAQRGWVEPAHVINTRRLGELKALLRTTMLG